MAPASEVIDLTGREPSDQNSDSASQLQTRQGQALRQQQIIEQQQILLGVALNNIEESTASVLEVGKKLLSEGKFPESMNCLLIGTLNTELTSEFRASDETNALLYYFLGNACQFNDRLDDAVRSYQEVLKFTSATNEIKAITYASLADLHFRRGEIELAGHAYFIALKFHCSSHEFNADWSYRLGKICLSNYSKTKDKNDTYAARDAFEHGLKFNEATQETKMRLMSSLGTALSSLGQFSAAKKMLIRASKLEGASNENKAFFGCQFASVLVKEGLILEAYKVNLAISRLPGLSEAMQLHLNVCLNLAQNIKLLLFPPS